jgi:hypothetical protein
VRQGFLCLVIEESPERKSKKFFLQHRLIGDLKKSLTRRAALHPNVAASSERKHRRCGKSIASRTMKRSRRNGAETCFTANSVAGNRRLCVARENTAINAQRRPLFAACAHVYNASTLLERWACSFFARPALTNSMR